MPTLAVEIARFVDESFPGFVECRLVDANNEVHFFIEKTPVVSIEDLLPTSTYPRPGEIGCEVLTSWQEDGKGLAKVTTEKPWGLESISGQKEFVVLTSQLRP